MKRLNITRRRSRQRNARPPLDYPESSKNTVSTWEAALIIAVPVSMVALWLQFSVYPALFVGILGLLIVCELRIGILKMMVVGRSGARWEGLRKYAGIAWRTLLRIAEWILWLPRSP